MSSLVQRKGRSGWYVVVPVPRPLRSKLGGSVIRKAGSTHKEALSNRAGVLMAIDNQFKSLSGEPSPPSGELPLHKAYEATLGPLDALSLEDKQQVIDTALQCDNASVSQLEAIANAMDGKDTWQRWIEKRTLQEQPAPSTVILWKTRLKKLSEWLSSEYLQDITELQAVAYKDYLLGSMAQSSVRSELGTLKAFWTWAVDHKQIKDNVWQGLTRKLKDSDKRAIADAVTIERATKLAIESKDYRYLIMRYTGCRANEASGLRHCDINLDERTITFAQWSDANYSRRLKGKQKDERTVPINDALYEALVGIELNRSNEPVWPKSYKRSNESWGQGWSGSFKDKFNFTSHDLRRNAVTTLAVAGVSPFVIYEITRQKIPGMSEVVSLYVRPTVQQLREAMELL